jgi:hypothetical protein
LPIAVPTARKSHANLFFIGTLQQSADERVRIMHGLQWEVRHPFDSVDMGNNGRISLNLHMRRAVICFGKPRVPRTGRQIKCQAANLPSAET